MSERVSAGGCVVAGREADGGARELVGEVEFRSRDGIVGVWVV